MEHDIDYRNPEDTTASRLFDLRTIIGAVFVLYGAILIIAGLFDSQKQLAKANGIRINLWLGMSMFVLGALFLLWVRLRPVKLAELEQPSAAEQAEYRGGRDDEGRGYDSRYDESGRYAAGDRRYGEGPRHGEGPRRDDDSGPPPGR